jgi:hypothetical protein
MTSFGTAPFGSSPFGGAAPSSSDPFPADLPFLVGRQYSQDLSTSLTVDLPSPTADTVVSAGHRASPELTVSALTAGGEITTAVISENWVIQVEVEASPPTLDDVSHVGYATTGEATVKPPTAHASTHREFLTVIPPAQTHEFLFDPKSHLWGYWLDGMSLARVDGVWVADYIQVPSEVEGLDRCFRGGHRSYISPDDAAELIAAGFGEFLRTEVSK